MSRIRFVPEDGVGGGEGGRTNLCFLVGGSVGFLIDNFCMHILYKF